MGFSTTLLGVTLSTTIAAGSPGSGAAPCAPARLGPSVASQADDWRRAAVALVESTATPGLPWSCAGGEIDLVATDDGATLSVTTAEGATIARKISWPDEVQPLGEALLARPLPPPAEVVPPPAPIVEATPLTPPRVMVSATIGPRYALGPNLIWGGVTIGGAIPIGRWGGGLWLRYDGVSKRLGERAPPMREMCFGGSAFRSFEVGPVELRAGLEPTLAVINQAEERDDDTKFDFRLGAEMATIIPITKTFRAIVALDSEISPAQLARRAPSPHEREAIFPKLTVGLGVGIEVAIR